MNRSTANDVCCAAPVGGRMVARPPALGAVLSVILLTSSADMRAVEATAIRSADAPVEQAASETTPTASRAPARKSAPERQRRTASSEALPEVTVTGQLLPDPVIAVDHRQATDVRGLFEGLSSVEVGGGVRAAQRLYLRGIESTNVNITVDGARQGQNLYNHRGGTGNVEPEILRRVEIQPGPVTADQGHGALGGEIRYITIDAQDRLVPGEVLGGVVKSTAANADRLRRGVIGTWAALGAHSGLLFYGSYGDYDDYRTGGGFRVPFSGGQDRTALLKWTLLDAGGHDLRIAIEHNHARGLNFMQRGDYPWQLQPIDFRTRPPQLQIQRRDRKSIEWHYDGGPGWLDLRLSGYDTRDDFFAPGSRGERFTSGAHGLDVRNTVAFGIGPWTWNIVFGVDRLDQRGQNQRNDREPRPNRYRNTGSFLQNRLGSESLDIDFGVRHDAFQTRFRTTNRVENEATLVNFGGRYRFGGGWSLFGGHGEAARGGGTIPIHFAGNVVENATFNGRIGGDLRPERADQRQFGLRWGSDDDALTIEAVRFRTEISHPILYAQPGSGGLGNRPVTGFFNADRSARWSGLELRGQLRLGAWSIDGGATHVRTRDLPSEPQFLARYGAPLGDRLTVSIDRTVGSEWRVGYTLTAVDRARHVPTNQSVFLPQPGYATHDLALNWQPAALAGFGLGLALRNLTDRLYVRHTTFTQNGFATEEPGRDLRLTVAYRF